VKKAERDSSEHRWASDPKGREQFYEDFGTWPVEIPANVPPKTACKHGRDECETCGTTNRRDVLHKTIGGKGVVGRLKP